MYGNADMRSWHIEKLRSVHDDWFSLWDSKVSRWSAPARGPRRNLIVELAAAVRAQGLKFGGDTTIFAG
jgi:alpha-L-fucosidase